MKFNRLNSKKDHELIHKSEKPFACRFCDLTFRHLKTVKEHERTHTGEKPYVCNFCGMKFTLLKPKNKHESFCDVKFRNLHHQKVTAENKQK